MKANFLRLILIATVTILFVACESSSTPKLIDEQNNTGGGGSPKIQSKGKGLANKGPFIKGSIVTAYKLNSNGSRILDKVVTTKTLDNTGIFSIEIPWTGLTELHIEGTYLNELTGQYMNDGNLSSIIDMKKDKKNEAGINLLTDISKKIIVGKMEKIPDGNFENFEKEAKEVIVEQFNLDENISFGALDVTKTENAENIQLLELSSVVLGTDDPKAVLDDLVEALSNVDEDGELDAEGNSVFEELQEVDVDLDDVVGNLGNNLDGVEIKSNFAKLNGELGLKSKIRFPRINNALLDTNYTSEMVTINGIIGDVPASLSINKGWYKINGAAPAQKATFIKNGDTLQLIQTSSVNYSTKERMNVKIGKKSIRFVVKTISDKKANDGKPDKFTFGSQRNVPINTEVTSDIMKVTGINVKANISIDKGEYSINGGEYTSNNGTVQNEDNITVRVKTGSELGQKIVAKVIIGTDKSGTRTGKFVVYTERKDRTPEISGLFTTVSGVEKLTSVTSNSIKVTDINVPVKVRIKGAEFSIDGGKFQSKSSTIKNGQSIRVRAISSNSFDTKKEFLLNIGRVVIPFTVITKSNPVTPDGTPDKFKFNSIRTQEASKLIESNIITVSSINQEVAISVTNGEYSINGGDYTSNPSKVKEGDKVQLRVTSADYGSEQNATLDIGGVKASFIVKTIKDEIPDLVFFPAKVNVVKGTQIESDEVNITGINVAIPVKVVSSGGEYSIDGGDYTSADGTITNNQSLRVRLNSADTANSSSVAVIKVGQMPLTFVTITQEDAPKFKTPIVAPFATEDKKYQLELSNFLEEGIATSWSMIGNPSWLTINPINGRLAGTPKGNDTVGSFPITVTAKNETGESTVTFDLVVGDVNYPPVLATLSNLSKNEDDKPFTLTLSSTDKDGTVGSYSATASNSKVTVSIVDNNLTITPQKNAYGSVDITVTVTDVKGAKDSKTFTLDLVSINDAPILNTLSPITINEDSNPVEVALSSSDVEGDKITYSATTSDKSKLTTVVNGSTLKLIPQPNMNGLVTVTVRANDGTDNSKPQTFNVTITPVNDAPILNSLSPVIMNEDSNPVEVTLNATDIENDKITYSVIENGSNNPAKVAINGSKLKITPIANAFGTMSVTVVASDGKLKDSKTISITVKAVNDAPILDSLSPVTINEDGTPAEVILSSTDVENDTITYVASSSDSTKLKVDVSGNILMLTPQPNMNGLVTVTVTANDGTDNSKPQTFNVTITPVNDTPVGVIDSITTLEDKLVVIDVLGNDTDIENDNLTITNLSTPSNGTVSIVDGKVKYTPNENYNGVDTFSYTPNDGTVDGNVVMVTVTVTPVNDVPLLEAIPAKSVDEDSAPFTIELNATDVDGDTITYTATSLDTTKATVSVNGSTLTVTPIANMNGDVSITVTANDGTVNSNVENFVVTINPLNDAPMTKDINITTVEDTLKVVNLIATDIDVGDTLSYSIVSDVQHGTTTITNGVVRYTPEQDYVGSDSFTYRANDGTVDSNVSTVTITVTAVNDVPVLGAIPAKSVDEDSAPFTIELNATDVDGDTITYTATSLDTTKATVSVNGSTLTVTPIANMNGDVSITVRANDGTVNSNVETFVVTINPLNDAPIITGTPTTRAMEDMPYSFVPVGEDIDEGTTLIYSIENNPTWAGFDSSTGALTGVPSVNDIGTTTGIIISVSDGNLTASLPPFDLEVTHVNHAPTIEGDAPSMIAIGSEYSFTPTTSDLDVNDTLTFSVENVPDWLDLNTTSGELSGIPEIKDIGEYADIVLSVTDDMNTSSMTLSIQVFDDSNITALPISLPIDLYAPDISEECQDGNCTKMYTYENFSLDGTPREYYREYYLDKNGTFVQRATSYMLNPTSGDWESEAIFGKIVEVNDNFIDVVDENVRIAVTNEVDISNQDVNISGLMVRFPSGAKKYTLNARGYGQRYFIWEPKENYATLEDLMLDTCEQQFITSKASENSNVGLVPVGCTGTETEGILEERNSTDILNDNAGHWVIKTVNNKEMLVIYPSVSGYNESEDDNESLMFTEFDNGNGSRLWQGAETNRDGTQIVFTVFNEMAMSAIKQKMLDAQLGIKFRFTTDMLANQNRVWNVYPEFNETTGEEFWKGSTLEFTTERIAGQEGILPTVDNPIVDTNYSITDRGQVVFFDSTKNELAYLTIVDMTESNMTVCESNTSVPTCGEGNFEFVYFNQSDAQNALNGLNASAILLPSGFVNQITNNLGTKSESSNENYKIRLYSDYPAIKDQQVKNKPVIVTIDGVGLPILSIHEAYKGRSIVVAVYDLSGKLIYISNLISIVNDDNAQFIHLFLEN